MAHLTIHAMSAGLPQIGTALGFRAKKNTNIWNERAGEDGDGRFVALGDIPSDQLAERVMVRINDGTSDVFAFVPTSKARRALDNPGRTEVDLSGPGLRWLLHKGQVLQEDTSDCAEPANERVFGWMSAAYDDTAWTAPLSYGKFVDGPWNSPRPKDWPDPMAEYIWPTTAPDNPGTVYFRKTFTTAAEQYVVVVAAADDEYRLFLDDEEILSTIGGGPFQWKRAQQHPMRLCPGTHVIAMEVRNLPRPVGLEATNYGWALASIYPADADGVPASASQLYKVFHDHSAGSFTLTASYETTSALAFNATAAAVQAALEALPSVGAGNVTVSGSGTVASPWEVTFTGDLANVWVLLEGDGSALTGGTGFQVDEWTRGSYAAAIVHTNTGWKCLDNPATVPGLTPRRIARLVLEEAQARGDTDLDFVTLAGTDAADPTGAAYPQIVLPVPLPADVHRVVQLIEELGFPVHMAPDLTLSIWNPATRGVDRTATVSILAHTQGVANLVAERSEAEVLNVYRVRTDEGWHEVVDAASVLARGRVESGQLLEGFGSEAEAELVTGPTVEHFATPPRTTRCDLTSEGPVVPYVTVDLADIVTASAFSTSPDAFESIPMRLVGVTGQIQERSIVYSVELIS